MNTIKKSEIIKLVQESVQEVLKEIITEPVDKDPSEMTDDEKKQALANARLKTGASDPNTPVDLVKKEAKKLREMPRTAIRYKLAPDYEEKLKNAEATSQTNYYKSASRRRWIDGMIDYLKGTDEHGNPKSDTVKNIAWEKWRAPQQMINGYAQDLIRNGVLVPAGYRGQEDVENSSEITPQFLRTFRNPETGEELPSAPTKLANWGKDKNRTDTDAEDLFVGGGFDDNFGDEENPEVPSDTMTYGDGEEEEPNPDELEKTDFKKGIPSETMDKLMKYDDLIRQISIIRGNLRKNPNLYKNKGLEEISADKAGEAKNQRNLLLLYRKKKEELKQLLATDGSEIAKYRDVSKFVKDNEIDIDLGNDEDTSSPVDEEMFLQERLRRLAGIKKH